MRIAILGGSFNPPHLAHQMACLYLLEGENFDQVWLIPTYKHAFSKLLVSFQDRANMCKLAAKTFGDRVVVSEIESRLATHQGNRTEDTVKVLKAHHPEHVFTLVIGSDLLTETSKWKGIRSLKQEIGFLVLLRAGYVSKAPGWEISPLVLPELSSSQIRHALKTGQSVRGLVSGLVQDYIEEHGMYGLTSHEPRTGESDE